jgi:hypothetical protein
VEAEHRHLAFLTGLLATDMIPGFAFTTDNHPFAVRF